MFWKIIINQGKHKWGVTLLVFLAMTSLVTLYVYLLNANRFTNRSMQLVMKNMGHNMVILPNDANPLDTYLCTGDQRTFSDHVTHHLAQFTHLFSRYYVSVLQRRVKLDGDEFLLTGIEPVARPDETREKGNLIKSLPPGKARVGAEVAACLRTTEGGPLSVLGRTFEITQVLTPKGTEEDFRIYVPLSDCQDLLGQPAQINVIWAFQCLHHGGPLTEIEAIQRKELAKVQPGFKHISKMAIAQGRYLARETTSKTLYCLLGIVFVATVLIIAITGMQEVAERKREVGILVSMGTGFSYIIGLYLVKILGLALAASLVGFVVGSKLAVGVTSAFLVTQTQSVRILWNHLPWVMTLTCLVALFAMFLPMIQLVHTDPNATLVEE